MDANFKHFHFLLLSLFLVKNAAAQTDSTSNKSPFHISGNADIYYRYSQNKTSSANIPSYAHDRLGLGWINLLTEAEFERWGFTAELGAGDRAVQLYSAEGEEYSYIIQGFAYYNLNEKLRASFGAFTTHFNYEYTEPGSNGNYTNTFIYTIIPASYAGLRLDYQLNDNWSFMLGLYGDSDRRMLKNNGPHIGGMANYAGERLNMAINLITGRDGDSTHVFMLDDYGDFTFSKRFKLGWELHFMHDDNDASGKTNWYGVALYAHEQLAKRFSLNLRSEWLNDPDGYWFGYLDNPIFSNTLTGKFDLSPIILMPEIRLDRAGEAVFEKSDGSYSKQEFAFLMGAAVMF